MPKTSWVNRVLGWRGHLFVWRMARQEAAHVPKTSTSQPVVFFNASSRITGMSQNAAFTLLTSWALRLSGVPVRFFVCQRGMSHCVLGTDRADYHKAPPCEACLRQTHRLYRGADVQPFGYHPDPELVAQLMELDVEKLSVFEYNTVKGRLVTPGLSIPLGRLVLPSVRWALRRHTLPDDE
ncbi:MAG: hypothetical protein ACKOC5_17315, partial [Chloroflexota bacterium]